MSNTKENQMEKSEHEVVVKSQKKGTPPGWRPASQLPKLKAPHGYTAKWADPKKLSQRLAEGWVRMKRSDNRGSEIVCNDVNNPSSLTDHLTYMDMIAIMLPQELKEQRDEWVRNENKQAMKGILDKTDSEFKKGGVETYTPAGHEGRIVIS